MDGINKPSTALLAFKCNYSINGNFALIALRLLKQRSLCTHRERYIAAAN